MLAIVLLALFALFASATAQEACDADDTAVAWRTRAIQPPGCAEAFREEASLLDTARHRLSFVG